MSRGIEELKACFETLMSEVKSLRQEQDPTAPLTAEGMCARWAIPGMTHEQRLDNLARRCRDYGLRPLKGTRGWEALYGRAEVLAAESYAAGKSKRRRAA